MGSHAITYAVVALAIAAVCLIGGFVWGRSNVKAQIENAVEKEHVALDAREFAMRTQLEDAIAEIAKLRPLAEELGRVQKRLEREQAKYAQMRVEFNAAMGSEESLAQDSANSEPPPAQTQESADEAIQKLLQSLEVFNDPNAPAAEVVAAEIESAPAPAPPAVARPVAAAQPTRIAEPPRPAEVPKAAEAARPVAPVRPAEPQQPRAPIAAQPIPERAVPERATAAAAGRPAPPASQPEKAVAFEPPRPVVKSTSQPAAAPAAAQAKASPAGAAKPGQQVDEWQEFARQLEALTGKKK